MSLLDKVFAAEWAVMPATLGMIVDVVRRESPLAREEWPRYAALERKPADGYKRAAIVDGVAVLPIAGVIIPKADRFAEISGATSLETAGIDLAHALADPDVRAVVLEIDSPGGSVFGVDAFAQKVAAAGKPVVAFTDGLMASAAFWIGAAAREIIADKSAQIGSVGVVGAVRMQVAPDRDGEFAFEIVSSGAPFKRADPRIAEHAAAIRERLNDYEGQFVAALATYRRTTPEAVLEKFGRGMTFIAGRAHAAGMIDRMGSLRDAIARARALSDPQSPAAHNRAADAGAITAGPTPQEEHDTMSKPAETGGAPATPAPPPAAAAPAATVTIPPAAPAATAPATPPAVAVDSAASIGAAVKAERERAKAIRAAALPGQEALAEEAIETGLTVEQFAVSALAHEKAKGAVHIKNRRQAEQALAPIAPGAAVPASPSPAAGALPATEEAAKKQYAADAALQREFGTEATYLAFVRGERRGWYAPAA